VAVSRPQRIVQNVFIAETETEPMPGPGIEKTLRKAERLAVSGGPRLILNYNGLRTGRAGTESVWLPWKGMEPVVPAAVRPNFGSW
jgi:hypothetical protein